MQDYARLGCFVLRKWFLLPADCQQKSSSSDVNITGPFLDKQRRTSKRKWYLHYCVPELGANGSPVMVEGKVKMERHRPYYESKALAEADKPRIRGQYGTAGAGDFIHSRDAQSDYSQAVGLLPAGVTVTMAAQFYARHNPKGEVVTLEIARSKFLEQRKLLVGDTRHYRDLDWRTAAFVTAHSGRPAASITRSETMTYLLNLKGEPRSKLNHKRALCTWGNWMIEAGIRADNPFGGIKRKQLPKVLHKEVEFFSLTEVEAYLRAAERYDPELLAHEIVQLLAGVRADDEMADFRGEWVKASTREVVLPAEITKTGNRAVIDGLEDNFWAWWKAYGRDGLLRPRNYKKRFWRIRILSQIPKRDDADRMAGIWVNQVVKTAAAKPLLLNWPWNARRRTFCTYHVAKYRSADRTALILRHKGSVQTLHDSYRGTGVKPAQGKHYFTIMPKPVSHALRPRIKQHVIGQMHSPKILAENAE